MTYIQSSSSGGGMSVVNLTTESTGTHVIGSTTAGDTAIADTTPRAYFGYNTYAWVLPDLSSVSEGLKITITNICKYKGSTVEYEIVSSIAAHSGDYIQKSWAEDGDVGYTEIELPNFWDTITLLVATSSYNSTVSYKTWVIL